MGLLRRDATSRLHKFPDGPSLTRIRGLYAKRPRVLFHHKHGIGASYGDLIRQVLREQLPSTLLDENGVLHLEGPSS